MEDFMKRLRFVLFAMLLALPFAKVANAQVAVCVGVGPAVVDDPYAYNDGGYDYAPPVCDWGYYAYYPYACAPYGYYGPQWFTGGIFIGAGPWFHGAANFHGKVDNRFHPEHGYKGPVPARGEKPEPSRRFDKIDHFKGNEVRDGRGHIGKH